MSLESTLFALGMAGVFICLVLYILFGQLTVRKLRKNPLTKNNLGIEFASGWDILNVAGALSTPRWLREKLEASSLSMFSANYQVLYEHTTIFDRILARIFWGFYVVPIILIMTLAVLSLFELI